MRILHITLKDLAQMLRDKRSFLFLLAMPLVFTLFMGAAMRGGAPADPRLAVGWIDHDPAGPVTRQLHDLLSQSDSLRLVEMAQGQEAQANQQVAAGTLAAVLVVPQAFSQQVMDGQNPQIVLLADPVSANGQTVQQLVQVPVTRVMSSVEIARLEAGSPQDAGATFNSAASIWQATSSSGPQIVIEKAQGALQAGLDLSKNPYNQSSPGMLVMFAIFGLVTSATIVVQERRSRTLERMVTTSLGRPAIIAGHLLAMFLLIFLQEMILVVFGQFILHVDYLRQPLGTLLVMLGLGLWVAALGLLIGVAAKAEEQVVLYSMAAMFFFSALGGAWFPLEGAGRAFTLIGHLTPAAWAMNGFQNILVRGLDTASVVLPLGVLLLYALGFFGLSAWLFRRSS